MTETTAVHGTATTIRDEAELRELLGEPSNLVRAKVTDRLNELTRQFVDRSPFVLLATSAADGCERKRGQTSAAPAAADETNNRTHTSHRSIGDLRDCRFPIATGMTGSSLEERRAGHVSAANALRGYVPGPIRRADRRRPW